MRNRRYHRRKTGCSRNRKRLTLESLETRYLLASDQPGIVPLDSEPRFEMIIGGGPASEHAYPWAVSLQDNLGRHFCGGALIDSNRILTAAHCVQGDQPSDIRAIIGRYDLSTDEGEEIRVEKTHIYPKFHAPTLESDLAILELVSESAIMPIDTATQADAPLFAPGQLAVTVGWGDLDDGTRPEVLNEVFIPIVSQEQANGPNSYQGDLTENMLAAGAAGKDACQGDSGGPMAVMDADGRHVLAGIVSWGRGCGVEGLPGIYTRVANFTEYIHDPNSFVAPDDDHRNRPTSATRISNGSYAGDLEVSADVDWFAFPAEAGQTIRIETELGTLANSVLTLYDADGTTVLGADDNSGHVLASRIEWTPELNGTYFVAVSSAGGFGAGTYRLFLSGARIDTLFEGDVNGDGSVDANDLNLVALNWQKTDATLERSDGDLNGDGHVGSDDLNLIGRTWQFKQSDITGRRRLWEKLRPNSDLRTSRRKLPLENTHPRHAEPSQHASIRAMVQDRTIQE